MLAKSYLKVQLISNIFSLLGYTLTSVIRAFGYPKAEMFITAFAVIVNIVFNTLFVFVMHLGFIGWAFGNSVLSIFIKMFSF